MTSYTALWHELRDHYRRRRPVDLWTGVPLLTDKDVAALARRWGRVLDDHADDLGAAGVPETILVDPEGKVAFNRPGPVDAAILDAEVTPLIESGSGS